MSNNLTTTGRNAPQGDRLTIPAAVWEHRVDGVPLVAGIVGEVLVGVPHAKITDGTATPADAFGPPADLVALRDARCECVDGGTPGWIGSPEDLTPCPDCHNGRLLHDVRVECIDVHKYSERSARARLERRRKQGGELFMVEHNGDWYTGSYRNVSGLIDVVPVVKFGDDDPGMSLCYSRESRIAPWWLMNAPHHVPLTPAHVEALGTIQPGQWAWLFTEVEA